MKLRLFLYSSAFLVLLFVCGSVTLVQADPSAPTGGPSITSGTLVTPTTTNNSINTNYGYGDIGNSVAAAVSCANAGGAITNGINSLISNSDSSTIKKIGKELGFGTVSQGGQTVPTADAKAQQALKWQNFKTQCLDKIAYNMAQRTLTNTTAKTLNWITTGYGGSPFYLLNQSSYFKSIADQKIANFLSVPKTCTKYEDPQITILQQQITIDTSPNDQIALQNQITALQSTPQDSATLAKLKAQGAKCVTYSATQSGPFDSQIRSNLISQLTGKQVQPTPDTSTAGKQLAAFNTDFRNGGWDMWQQTIDGNYNPITSYINQTGTLGSSIQKATTEAQTELTQGQGFLSQKKCVQYENKPWKSDPNSPDYDPSYKPACIQWKTVTPGTLIADQAKTTLQVPTRQLQNITQFNQVLGSFFGKIVDNLLNKGVASLGSYASGDYSAFGGLGINTITNPSTVGTVTISPATGVNDITVQNPGSVRDVIKNQYDYLSAIHDSAKAVARITPNLGILDYCLPGPHQTWGEEFTENTVPFAQAVIDASNGGSGWRDVHQISLKDFVTDNTYTKEGFSIRVQSGFGAAISGIATVFNKILSVLPGGSSIGQAYNNLFIKQTDTSGDASNFITLFSDYLTDITTAYTTDNIVNQFTAVEPASNQLYTSTIIKSALMETANLTDVYNNSSVTLSQYNDENTRVLENIRNLERIYAEAESIVVAARNRHIALMKQQGYTVNMQCLDSVYDVNQNYTTRQNAESDTSDPLVQAVIKKQADFYTNIGTGDPGNGQIDQYIN